MQSEVSPAEKKMAPQRGATSLCEALNLLCATHFRADRLTMVLIITVVARVEARVKPSVVLDNLIHAMTMVICLRHSYGVSADAFLCDRSPGLRCSSRLDRQSWGHHAQYGCGCER